MDKQPATPDPESLLLKLEDDLLHDEGSDTIEAYDSYTSARKALLDILKNAMDGVDGSSVDHTNYLNLLLDETAKEFAHVMETIEEHTDRIELAARCLQMAVIEFNNFISNYETEFDVVIQNIPTIIQAIETVIEDVDTTEDEIDHLRILFHSTYGECMERALADAQDNKQESKQQKMNMLKYQALDLLKDATKIALGATAAVLVTQRIHKNNPSLEK